MTRLVVVVFNVLLFSLCIIIRGSSVSGEAVGGTDSNAGMSWANGSGGRVGDVSLGAPKKMKYTRAAEVKAKCPALELRNQEPPSRTRRPRPLMQRLSFMGGDWKQDDEAPPVMPYMQDSPGDQDSTARAKTQLGSFIVTNVARNQLPVRNVAGIVELRITDGTLHSITLNEHEDRDAKISSPRTPDFRFDMMPGFSSLTIEVEGIYQQAMNEDVLCLLGCTYLPSPDAGITWSNMQNQDGTKELVKDCDIMLQLHYPLTFNLTSRVIRGEITSLKTPDQPYYFWPISLSSQVSASLLYESTAKDLVTSVCSSEDPGSKHVDAYKPIGLEFCDLAREYIRGGWMDIEPNWNCTVSQEFCGKIGPFSAYSEHYHHVKEEDYNTSNVQILVQNFRSPRFTDEEAEISVSGVFRLVPRGESLNTAILRSALDGQTIVTEGYWTNGSDHLCMVGCSVNDSTNEADLCDLRVCLSIPISLSIKHRNVFDGSISSTLDEAPFHPLSFHVQLEYNRGFPWRLSNQLHYNYSRLDEANAVLTKYEPVYSNFHTSWSSYPKLIGETLSHYKLLSEDLNLYNKLDSSVSSYVTFEVVAIDDYLPFIWSGFVQSVSVEDGEAFSSISNDTIRTDTDPSVTNRHKETREYLNVAGTLSINELFARKEFKVFTEGRYSPKDGKMYMVGCRSVKASWGVIHDFVWSLDEGMDCDIEVIIGYPATFASWLTNPSVEVVIKSKRTEDNPFYFDEIKVKTKPILYRKQREQLLSQRSIEGALSVLTLSVMLACIISQLVYLGHHVDSTPYVSLVTIGIQAFGFAIPLVTGAESLLTRKFDYRRDFFYHESGWTQMIIYLDKILTLVAFLLMVRLFEVVWRSRSVLPSSTQSPDERGVAITCFIIHALGFISVVALHNKNSNSNSSYGVSVDEPQYLPEPVVTFMPTMENFSVPLAPAGQPKWVDVNRVGPVWKVVLQEYAGLVDDLFLLPQVIAFSVWDVHGKPLRTIYYLGLTFLQIVPHVYDSVRIPGLDGFSETVYANPKFDFYTSLGNILIPILALTLALLLSIQQRWKNFLRFPSRFSYKPLSSKMNETELVQNHGRTPLPPIPEDEE